MKITKEKIELLTTSSVKERKYLVAKRFKLFCVYYFTKYFTYKSPPFHDDFYQDFEDLVYGDLKDAAWIGFRESAKSSIGTTMGLTWIVCRQEVINELKEAGEEVAHWGERSYINVDCYDKTNSEMILFDLVTELQSNELIVGDFGHLYNKPRTKDENQLKRVANFITNNGIRVEAHTALKSVRGRRYGHKRPDFRIMDDIENEITAESPPITEKIIKVLDAGKGGMAGHGSTLTLGNYVIEEGVIGYIMKTLRGSGGRVRFIPVVDKQGVLAWPEKFVKTDEEAVLQNAAIHDPTRRKISLESKKREMNAGGRRVYEVEMLLDPVAAGSPFFDRAKIEELIAKSKAASEVLAGLHVWESYKASDAYGFGADVGKGNGGDHSTSCGINFSTIPARVVATYVNNQIPADLFAYELKRHGDLYGTCLLAPEKNAEAGGSCLTTLKMIYPTDMIYWQRPLDKNHEKPVTSGELGWETNTATKYLILNDFRTAVEAGHLVVLDIRLLLECKSFTHSDADDLGRTRQGLFTRHFDLLMAAAIAWHMRKYAVPKVTNATYYQQKPYERPGI